MTMKTSTKLLILFFLALPTTLFAYNWLMREQYLTGNLVPEIDRSLDGFSDSTDYIKKQLPPCKYVVISGEITSGSFLTRDYSSFWSEDRYIYIHGNHKGPQVALVNKYYESLFKTKLTHDTLYVYFYREKHIGNISSNNSNLVGLYLNNDVEYIRAELGDFNINGSFNLQHMDIDASGTNTKFSIDNLQTDQLNLTCKGAVKMDLNRAKKISSLSYSLFDSTTVKFNNCQVAAYKALHIDTAAKLNVTVKGNAIAQYLATKH